MTSQFLEGYERYVVLLVSFLILIAVLASIIGPSTSTSSAPKNDYLSYLRDADESHLRLDSRWSIIKPFSKSTNFEGIDKYSHEMSFLSNNTRVNIKESVEITKSKEEASDHYHWYAFTKSTVGCVPSGTSQSHVTEDDLTPFGALVLSKWRCTQFGGEHVVYLIHIDDLDKAAVVDQAYTISSNQ